MRQRFGLGLSGIGLALLASCATLPGISSAGVDFGTDGNAATREVGFSGNTQLRVRSERLDQATASAVKAGTLFIGDQGFSQGELFTVETDSRYQWVVTSPCKVLPQDKSVVMRYELYGEGGAVVQQNSLNIIRLGPC